MSVAANDQKLRQLLSLVKSIDWSIVKGSKNLPTTVTSMPEIDGIIDSEESRVSRPIFLLSESSLGEIKIFCLLKKPNNLG